MGSALLSESLLSESLAFARLLRTHRDRARLTQEDLAERARLSVRTVRDLERGRTRYPHRTSVRRLAAALGLTGDDRAAFEAAPPRPLGVPAVAPPPEWDLPPVSGTVSLRRLPLLREVEDAVASAATGGNPALVEITGPAGTGKTTLAAQCAYVLRERLALDTVFLDLHRDRRDPGELRAAVRSARARRTAPAGPGGRCLLLADGATDAERVLPLLAIGFTAVLVTAREPVAGLAPSRRVALTRLA
ncbi:transcriptional regulator with XRE-family HTH domain [Streptosporangium becharense]|uniref:Transcriptional regulator with XRE-family HTH domain n=1 Tax=Streptosporangium becharense TaxID=1816182 RepID=A0A7W9MKF0_9ACTN|nr:helix-turn-helix domain-containing protein [Streptosporangium becharense]MBB2914579.1 transcriptional regulator with XRE-family HTH domain [Streptosporangium becharense]MBB5823424.1 transcriptional regulator with XRE-family HTH domain [Streptosporangium becharense]